MYVCVDCGKTFYKPNVIIKNHGVLYPPFETFHACPYCGGDFTMVNTCQSCGEYIADDFIELKDGSKVCSECYIDRSVFEFGED